MRVVESLFLGILGLINNATTTKAAIQYSTMEMPDLNRVLRTCHRMKDHHHHGERDRDRMFPCVILCTASMLLDDLVSAWGVPQ